MGITEFSKVYADRCGLSQEFSLMACNAMFQVLDEVLFEMGEDVVIPNFGSFKHKTASGFTVKHPETGEDIIIPQRDVVKFKWAESSKKKRKES